MNRLILFYLMFLFPLSLFAQEKSLKVIEPDMRFTPVLSESKLKEELKKIQIIWEKYGNDYYKYLTERQIEIEDWDYYDRPDCWDVGQIGDGWYNCGWPQKITASSVLKSGANLNYGADNAHDFSLRTAWVEGVEGDGIGESITYCFPKENPPITTVDIFNGYMKSDQVWQDNARVKQLKLSINGKPYVLLNLKDTKSMQSFNIGSVRPENADLYLKFEIMDVYKGDKYDDTAISEIEFDGTGCLCFAEGTLISTPDGDKKIEQLRVGDKVLSLNVETNTIEIAIVLSLATRTHELYELDFDGIKIKITEDHPFYFRHEYYSIVPNNTYGMKTRQLVAGQQISLLSDGKLKERSLNSIQKLKKQEITYTITKLDKNHLFFANGICVTVEQIK